MSGYGYSSTWRIAWPIILANSAAPLLGLADTAVIGHTGETIDLGAIALGSLIFSFIYWSFGFLRMGTTGFVAQADGAGDEVEVRATLARALLTGAAIGIGLVVLQWPIIWFALLCLNASDGVEAITRTYVFTRIWGAPASLMTFALMGLLIGLGRSDLLLKVQLVLNGLNILFDVVFAGVLNFGVAGIAIGTVLAEWIALALAAMLIWKLLRQRASGEDEFWSWERILAHDKLKQTLSANTDIMVRTLCLQLSMMWFADRGARFGDSTLAGNHVLLQFIVFSAFVLDGFAFAAESMVGRAVGAKQRRQFDETVWHSTVLAGVAAVLLSGAVLVFGAQAIASLTDIEEVRSSAGSFIPYAAAYVLLSFPAFQLDGIFVGATRTRDMRNAAMFAAVTFLSVGWLLAMWYGNHGLWVALIVFVLARSIALGMRFNGLRQSI